MRITLTAFLFLFLPLSLLAQEGKRSGTVSDAVTKAPLAFVTISIRESREGTVTDIDGRFSFSRLPARGKLLISYIGYKTKELDIENINWPLVITLEPAGKELEAVVITSGENPAHRIIRLMQENKKQHDPEQQSSFKYNAYTVAALAAANSFWTMNRDDSSRQQMQQLAKIPNKPIDTTKDKQGADLAKRFRENYLMLMESYTERIFRFPAQTKETVLATKISGLKEAAFAITGTNFQPFGFYKDYIQMSTRFYVSPVINGSIGMYQFRLVEVLPHENDTSYIISFEPRKGKKFDGLKGVIHINSDGYAIENVIASPADDRGMVFSFRIQQKYERLATGKWFPVQFNSMLSQRDIRSDSVLLYWDSRCYISNAEIGQTLSKKNFSRVELDYHPLAGRRSDTAWLRMRTDTLNEKEKATYETFEMLPPKYKNSIEKANKYGQILAIEAIPWGKLDIPFKYILSGINKYESFRLGAGIQTNPLFSKLISIGGFAGYGLRDKAWKYGANLLVNIDERTATTIRLSYSQDVSEPGNIDYFVKNGSVFSNQSLRNLQVSRMDSVEQLRLDISTRLRPFLQFNTWILNEDRNPAGYEYSFTNTTNKTGEFRNTEIGMGLRFTRGESFARMGRAVLRIKPAKTQLLLQVSKGLKNVWNSDLDYTRAAVQFNHSFRLKKFGLTSFQLEAAQVWGNIPYSYLINLKASRSGRLSVHIPNTFQTAGLYEFVADKSANLFIQHNFGNLLFKPENLSIRPEIVLVQNISYGSLANADAQKQNGVKVAENGLFESGLLVKNLYRRSIYSICYIGLGGGVFYRYGNYELPNAIDNWAFKWGFTISF